MLVNKEMPRLAPLELKNVGRTEVPQSVAEWQKVKEGVGGGADQCYVQGEHYLLLRLLSKLPSSGNEHLEVSRNSSNEDNLEEDCRQVVVEKECSFAQKVRQKVQ